VAASATLAVNLLKRTRSGGAAEGATATRRRCGNCGGTGHNARPCQADAAEDSESRRNKWCATLQVGIMTSHGTNRTVFNFETERTRNVHTRSTERLPHPTPVPRQATRTSRPSNATPNHVPLRTRRGTRIRSRKDPQPTRQTTLPRVPGLMEGIPCHRRHMGTRDQPRQLSAKTQRVQKMVATEPARPLQLGTGQESNL
jgi:hypothetical protein